LRDFPVIDFPTGHLDCGSFSSRNFLERLTTVLLASDHPYHGPTQLLSRAPTMIRYFTALLILSIALTSTPATALALEIDDNASEAYLTKLLEKLMDEKETTEQDIVQIEGMRDAVQRVNARTEQNKIDAIISALKVKIEVIKKGIDGSGNPPKEAQLTDLNSTLTAAKQDVNTILTLQDPFWSVVPSSRDSSITVRDLSYRLRELSSVDSSDMFAFEFDSLLPKPPQPSPQIIVEDIRKTVTQLEAIAAAKPDFGSTQKKLNELITLELDIQNKKLSQVTADINAVNLKLHGFQSTFGSSQTSIMLMMAVLLICFLMGTILQWKNSDANIITDRTLIEFGGMAFLLLVVVILANGKRIDSSTVGPLLGTLAGYIFGKSITGEASRQQEQTVKIQKDQEAILKKADAAIEAVQALPAKKPGS